MSILKIKNLNKHFEGARVVCDLSISIKEGKITGIIGPNGSGKSTLVNLLTGMVSFDGGSIVVGDKTELKEIRSSEVTIFGVTRTFQETRLFEQMPVIDNILVVLTERQVFGAIFEKHKPFHLEKAEEVLKRVHLWEKRNELAVNLSYGQRKLLEIARVLAMTHSNAGEANIFFFDEPFAGLFPEMRKIVVSVMKELRQKGKTLVLIEHDIDMIRELCDYLFVMDGGKLLAEGSSEEVLRKKEVAEAYLGK